MPRFIRNFLFDHEQQIHDMLVLGAMLGGIAITYMTIHAVADLTTDTDSNHYTAHRGLQEHISESPYAPISAHRAEIINTAFG